MHDQDWTGNGMQAEWVLFRGSTDGGIRGLKLIFIVGNTVNEKLTEK